MTSSCYDLRTRRPLPSVDEKIPEAGRLRIEWTGAGGILALRRRPVSTSELAEHSTRTSAGLRGATLPANDGNYLYTAPRRDYGVCVGMG